MSHKAVSPRSGTGSGAQRALSPNRSNANPNGAASPRQDDMKVSGVKKQGVIETKIKLETVPEKVMNIVKGWKVKSAAVSKVYHPHVKPTPASAKASGKGKANKVTSVLQQFKPPVSFDKGVEWLQKNGAQDGMLLFDNESGITFEDLEFADFENMEEEEDDDVETED